VRRHLLAIALVATALASLMLLDHPVDTRAVEPPQKVPRPALPSKGATTSTWYCAAGSAGTGDAATHELVVFNPTGADVDAVISTFPARSEAAAPATTETTTEPATTTSTESPTTTIVAGPSTQKVAVAGRSSLVVPLATPGASAMVEFAAVGPVVTHRLVVEGSFDEAPCATSASAVAYFPTANTQTANGASSQLWLFNPFPADVSVDVQVASEDGVRTPGQLRGLVVAGGTSRAVELGGIVQTRDQFAMALRVRGGVIVAEQSRLEPGGGGLVLTPGVPATSTRLVFADGRGGGGIGERYVVYNPGSEEAAVLLGVVPFDTDLQSLPEKFDLAVPPRRYAVLDLQDQVRVPADRPHWVRLESVNGAQVVVQRLAQVLAEGSPWALRSGVGQSVGQPVMARRWVMPWADRAAESTSTLVVVNPSTDTIARVNVSRVAAGGEAPVGSEIELAPGGGVAIELGPAGAEPAGIEVASSSPVVAERRVAAASGGDLAVIAMIGRNGELAELPSMSHTTAVEIGGS